MSFFNKAATKVKKAYYISEPYYHYYQRLTSTTHSKDLDIVVDMIRSYHLIISYMEKVPQFDDNFKRLIDRFNQYQVKYVINKADKWVDLAPEKTDYSEMCDMWLAYHYDQCCQTWQELRNGKLYYCNYAAVAGLVEETKEETFDLRECGTEQKKQLIEFRLGYSEKGYTEFCKKCRGFTVKNTGEVEPALQIMNK